MSHAKITAKDLETGAKRVTHVVVIKDDRLWKSIVSDIFSTASLAIAVMFGRTIGSEVLEWVGMFLLLLFMLGKMLSQTKTGVTVSEARQILDQIENETK